MPKAAVATGVKIEKYTASLKVKLTADEIADRADRAAQMIAERDAKEEEFKAAAKHNKSVIEAMEAELRRLSNEVRTRSTYSPVEVERKYLYTVGLIEETRMDTSEVISSRNMTDGEKQRELPFAGSPTSSSANGDGGSDD